MARQAIAAAGDDPWVLDFAGLAPAQLAGDNDAALSALDRAIVLNLGFALAFGHRAVVLLNTSPPYTRPSWPGPPSDPFVEPVGTRHISSTRHWRARSWQQQVVDQAGLCGPKRRCAKTAACRRFASSSACAAIRVSA